GPAGGSRRSGGARRPERPDVAVAVDAEVDPSAGQGAAGDGPPGVELEGGRAPPEPWRSPRIRAATLRRRSPGGRAEVARLRPRQPRCSRPIDSLGPVTNQRLPSGPKARA